MWLTDPELFLYSKVGGDDVQVWRCKKTMMNSSSPLVVPMVPDDFEYVSQVEDHSELVDEDVLEWEETDYKALVKYISERRLLVNGQGLVIAELSKFSEEDEDDQTDAADILPIYLRSLDILQLKAYIPDLMEQPIPSRKVQYLEDADGKAAPVEGGDSTTTTTITTEQIAELQDDLERERSEILELAKRFADAEAEIKTLEAKNVNLDGTSTKLKQDLADAEAENKTLEAMNMKLKQDLAAPGDKNDLESKKRTLEENVTKLAAELVVWKQKFTDLESKTTRDQEERIRKLNAEIVVLKNKVKDLESTNKTQENRINTLNADLSSKTTQLATAQRELARLNNREPWMNDITPKSGWVGLQELQVIPWATGVEALSFALDYTVDDGKSNVATKRWINVRVGTPPGWRTSDDYRALNMDMFGSGTSKMKFDGDFCWTVRSMLTQFVLSKK